MTIKNLIIRDKSDKHNRRWKIREAVSLEAAMIAITSARVSGSIGAKNTLNETFIGGDITVLADVVQVNSDNTERTPYTEVEY